MNTSLFKITLPIVLLLGANAVNANGFYVAASGMHAEYEGDFDEAGYTAAIGKYIGEGKKFRWK